MSSGCRAGEYRRIPSKELDFSCVFFYKNIATSMMGNGVTVDEAYLSFAKPFDNVSQGFLLKNLEPLAHRSDPS